MKVGTKSVLFGYHCFFIHPWFVARGWWKLYGFPWKPWMWIMFFVHDLGYWGKPNMDGEEGEEHPRWGARVLYKIQTIYIFFEKFLFRKWTCGMKWYSVRSQWEMAHLLLSSEDVIWGNVSLYHSRFLAKKYNVDPSKLCAADKYAIVLTPWWIAIPLMRLTGEHKEYMARGGDGATSVDGESHYESVRDWQNQVKEFCKIWIEENKDGGPDTMTKDRT